MTGATWLTLATAASDGSSTDHTDWAAPVLTCGTASPGGPAQPTARTLFSFENGADGFTIANPGDGGAVSQSAAFHTDGSDGLAVQAPVNGNWFGEPLTAPLDLTGTSSIAVDMKAGPAGTTAEIAVQTGSATSPSWCQGGLWTWLNPGTTKIIQRTWNQIKCPTGVTLDLSQIHGIWVFLNTGGGNYIDNIRVK